MAKRILSLVLSVIIVIALLAGCGQSGEPSSSEDTTKSEAPKEETNEKPKEETKEEKKEEPKKKWRIGFSNASVSNTWRVAMYEMLMEEAKKHPEVEILYTDANDNAAKQNSDVEDLLIKGIDLLLISPATNDALNPAIEKAYDQGVPVVVFDRSVSTDKYTTFVETSDLGCGEQAAKRLVEKLTEKFGEPKGNVCIIQGFMGSGPQIYRQKGIMSVLEKYPDIKIVGNQAADFQRAKGMAVMENMLQANKQIDAVISHSGESLCGAIDAIDAAGRGEGMIYVGIDGYNGLLKLIKKGVVDSTVLFPARLGAEALLVGLKILNGEEVPKRVQLPLILVTKDNVDEYVDMDAPDGAWTY